MASGLVLGGSFCLGSCGLGLDPEPARLGEGRPILFVGNSLTYENNLPSILQALADSTGVGPLAVAAVAAPDFSLQDHWEDGSASEVIADEAWSVVVLQQGPSALAESREDLRDYAARFSTEIRRAGANPALYGVWPRETRQFDFDASIESYRLAADDVGGLLFPVGAAWRQVLAADPDLALYAADGLHASPTGAYLGALVMYAVLFEASPIGLPPRVRLRKGGEVGVTPEIALVLQQAAYDVTRPTEAPPP